MLFAASVCLGMPNTEISNSASKQPIHSVFLFFLFILPFLPVCNCRLHCYFYCTHRLSFDGCIRYGHILPG